MKTEQEKHLRRDRKITWIKHISEFPPRIVYGYRIAFRGKTYGEAFSFTPEHSRHQLALGLTKIRRYARILHSTLKQGHDVVEWHANDDRSLPVKSI